jgi:hypothetical protein
MIEATLNEKIHVQGFLNIQEGFAYDIEKDENGNLIDWKFDCKNNLGWNQNKICFPGYSFVLSKGWGVAAVIGVGNGLVTGGNAPANTNTQLNSEITNGRFAIPDSRDGISRVNNGVITLQTLWPRGQGYVGNITEWGIFVTNQGGNLQAPNTGYLVSRIAQSYTRTAGNDLYLTWVITPVS